MFLAAKLESCRPCALWLQHRRVPCRSVWASAGACCKARCGRSGQHTPWQEVAWTAHPPGISKFTMPRHAAGSPRSRRRSGLPHWRVLGPQLQSLGAFRVFVLSSHLEDKTRYRELQDLISSWQDQIWGPGPGLRLSSAWKHRAPGEVLARAPSVRV